jgi:hypothetical protein
MRSAATRDPKPTCDFICRNFGPFVVHHLGSFCTRHRICEPSRVEIFIDVYRLTSFAIKPLFAPLWFPGLHKQCSRLNREIFPCSMHFGAPFCRVVHTLQAQCRLVQLPRHRPQNRIYLQAASLLETTHTYPYVWHVIPLASRSNIPTVVQALVRLIGKRTM